MCRLLTRGRELPLLRIEELSGLKLVNLGIQISNRAGPRTVTIK